MKPKNITKREERCHCGSVQFDYAGRCLACKSRSSKPAEEKESCLCECSKSKVCGVMIHTRGFGAGEPIYCAEKTPCRWHDESHPEHISHKNKALGKEDSNWEEEFDNLPNTNQTTKDFIRSVESKGHLSLLNEIIEDMKKLAQNHAPINGKCEENCELCDGYNKALSDVISLLEKKLK